MQRIPGVSENESGFLRKLVYRVARRRFGAVPDPMRVAAHHSGVLLAEGVHEVITEKAARHLPISVREIAVYRTATLLGCSWCIDFGTMLQRLGGLDIERLTEIDDYATSSKFTKAERLAIAYADAMTATPVTVTDEQVTELEREFGRKGVVELSYVIGLENSRARMNDALGVTDQGFTSGDACRVAQIQSE